MKKICFLIIMAICFISQVKATNFSDIENHWAINDIERMINNNVVDGYPDNTIKPDSPIKVNEFLKIFIDGMKIEKVHIGEIWPDWYIETAKFYGLILENEFDSYDRKITRLEACRVISRYLNLEDVLKSKNVFTDLNVSDRAVILRLVSLKIISGYEDNTFRGNNTLTRAESFVLVNRAIDCRRKQVHQNKNNDKTSSQLSNYGKDNSSIYTNRYEINNGKLILYDNGRYANLNGYIPNLVIIDNRKASLVIKSLITEDNYVAVSYIPGVMSPNKVIVSYGEKEGYMFNGSTSFDYTFYEEPYDLKKISLEDTFSDKCFMNISFCRTWKELNEIRNSIYFNEFNIMKLNQSLNLIFDNDTADKLSEYIIKNVPRSYTKQYDEQIKESININEYKIDMYSGEGTILDFYISK